SCAMLLFEEADSLFGKRTELKSAQDRFANLEVNYILQRMETFDGISVLTTNAEASIDPALQRRVNFRSRFPAPEGDGGGGRGRARRSDRRASGSRPDRGRSVHWGTPGVRGDG